MKNANWLTALIVKVRAFLQGANITPTVQETSNSAWDTAQYPSRFPAISAEERARSQRHEAWRERIAEYDAMDPYDQRQVDPYNTGMAEFIGGPLNDQIHAMSEALPSFYWAKALQESWILLNETAEPDALPQVDEYTYERQLFFSSTGNAVYVCRD